MRQLDDTCIVLAEVAWSFLWLSKIHEDPYLIIFCIYLLSLHLFALSFASPEICEFLQVLWSFELRLSMTFRHLGLVPCLMSDVVLGLQGGPDAWCFRLRRLSRPSRCPGSPFAPDDPVITPTRPVLHCPSISWEYQNWLPLWVVRPLLSQYDSHESFSRLIQFSVSSTVL